METTFPSFNPGHICWKTSMFCIRKIPRDRKFYKLVKPLMICVLRFDVRIFFPLPKETILKLPLFILPKYIGIILYGNAANSSSKERVILSIHT